MSDQQLVEILIEPIISNITLQIEHTGPHLVEITPVLQMDSPASSFSLVIEPTGPVIVEISAQLQIADLSEYAKKGETGNLHYLLLEIEANGQTQFLLPAEPANFSKTQLFRRGQKLSYPVDYHIDGAILTFIPRHYSLKTADTLEFYY